MLIACVGLGCQRPPKPSLSGKKPPDEPGITSLAKIEPDSTSKPSSSVNPPSSPPASPTNGQPATPKSAENDVTFLSDKDIADAKAANRSKPVPDSRLHGLYRTVVDEASLPASVRQAPDFNHQLNEARRNAPTMRFAPNGSIKATLRVGDTTGFLTRIKGRETVVLWNPNKSDKKVKVLTLPIVVYDNGDDFTIDLPDVPQRPLYRRVSE
jgi:hypothetical protein